MGRRKNDWHPSTWWVKKTTNLLSIYCATYFNIKLFKFLSDLLLLSSDRFCDGIHYNSDGDRLIFKEITGPQVIDLSVFTGGSELKGKKKLTSTVEKNHSWTVNGACCFAGANDELVVAASNWDDLHVWSVSQGHLNSSADNQQIMFLPFDDQNISGVFYSKERSALISCSVGNHTKVWTSFQLPQVPNENGMWSKLFT